MVKSYRKVNPSIFLILQRLVRPFSAVLTRDEHKNVITSNYTTIAKSSNFLSVTLLILHYDNCSVVTGSIGALQFRQRSVTVYRVSWHFDNYFTAHVGRRRPGR